MRVFSYDQWTKKRQTTTKIFCFMSFVLGVEYSLCFATSYVYLKDFLKEKHHLSEFYAGISGIYSITSVFSSVFFGKVFDATRRTRIIFSGINILVIIGNILYMIPLSPWLLFIGRLISGMAGCQRPIIASEINRSYPPEEIIPQMAAVACAFVIGFTIGPTMNFAFLNADFWFLGIHFKYPNGVTLVITLLWIIPFFVTIFFASDLSREFDLKENIKGIPEEEVVEKHFSDNENDEEEIQQNTDPLLQQAATVKNGLGTTYVLQQLFTNFDPVLMFAISFTTTFVLVTFNLYYPTELNNAF